MLGTRSPQVRMQDREASLPVEKEASLCLHGLRVPAPSFRGLQRKHSGRDSKVAELAGRNGQSMSLIQELLEREVVTLRARVSKLESQLERGRWRNRCDGKGEVCSACDNSRNLPHMDGCPFGED